MITSGQRAQLRKMANTMKATEQVGKSGITENLIRQLDETLEIKEMFKINVLETAFMSTKECAGQLADALGADVVIDSSNNPTLLYNSAAVERTDEVIKLIK